MQIIFADKNLRPFKQFFQSVKREKNAVLARIFWDEIN